MGDSMPGGPPSAAGASSGGRDVRSDAVDDAAADPDAPRDHTAWQLARQADACAAMGSPLYAHLLTHAAEDCRASGPTWAVLRDHAAPGRGDALALRLMAAVHRLVLQRRAPWLATCYPSAGGTSRLADVWPAFRATLRDRAAELGPLIARPCQTNEVGRSAALLVGLLDVARRTDLPLRLREVGASAGLNLRCDRFLVGGGGVTVGDADSPVDLSSHWSEPPPWPPPRLRVVDRRGCDRAPVDPATPEGRLTLTASVWADQTARLARLRGALRLAAEVPAPVDRASLGEWTADQLAELPRGAATVVFHSVVMEYVDAATRQAFDRALDAAGARATADAPLAWVRLEPIDRLRNHGVQVTSWPGGETTTLARSGAHGAGVQWVGDRPAGA